MLRRLLKKGIVLLGVVLLALIIVEILLSCLNIFPNDYFTATPNSQFTWEIKPGEIKGIGGKSLVKFDKLGARSISNFENATHKIIAIGGSTTACYALTQDSTWTALLEQKLGNDYWVGNFGRPGNSSNHHVQQIKHLLDKKELQDVETVVILLGANDISANLISEDKYLNLSEEDIRKASFMHFPNSALPMHKSLNLYKILRNVKRNLQSYFYSGNLTDRATELKQMRKKSNLETQLPSLANGLDHYEKNIIKIIDIAKGKSKNLILVTQPVLWDEGLSKEYEDLIMFGGVRSDTSFYSSGALRLGMDAYNNRLVSVCEDQSIPYLELTLPQDAFYDDVHYNTYGSKLVAEKIFQFLKK